MYKLYWAPKTGAFVVQAALEQADAAYDRVVVDIRAGAQKEPAYLAINSLGQVPSLALPDGQVVTESAAMVLHLADAFPGAGLLPAADHPDRPKALRWLMFLAMNVYGDNLRYNYAARYTDDPSGAPGVRAAAVEQLVRSWKMFDDALESGPFLLGETCCAVDIYAAMMTDWSLPRAQLFACAPRVARAFALVCELPAVSPIAEANELI